MGPGVLDRAEDDPEGLEIRTGDCSSRNSDFIAAQTIQTILVEVVAIGRTRAPESEFRDSQAGRDYGRRESNMGRTACARATVETRGELPVVHERPSWL